jgi:glycosyltransferase involved in cell wall biosynthesis
MPCLNEAETLEVCVIKAQDFLARSGVDGEVLIADNGSTDGSQAIARAAGARVVDVPQRGYGSALITGIQDAKGTFVIMGDADDSYDFSDLGAFVEALRNGADLVMGDRFAGGIAPGAMPPLHRYLGNPVLSFVGRLFFHSSIRDFHCGLRGFRRTSILDLDLQSTGMEFASEMVVKATLAKLDIAEVPTTLRPDGRTRAPHLRTWRDGWRHLRFLLLYSPRWLFLYPGIVLMAISFLVAIAVEITTVHIFSATLGVDTLVLASAGLIIGLQSVLFAVFTKIYGVNEGFLPSNTRLDRMSRWLTLEIGLAVGAGLAVLGAIGLIVATVHWSDARFGRLNTVNALHTVIPSATLLTFGFQVTLASLFVSILAIGRVRPPARSHEVTRDPAVETSAS